MKNLLRLLAGLKVSVKTNPTLVKGTVVQNIYPDDISQKETETELLLDDNTLAKAANYISMVENASKLGGVLHSVANVGPKKTASRLLNSMKLTSKDDMDMDEKITVILYNVTSLHELVRKKFLPLGLYRSGKGKGNDNSNGGNDNGKGNGNGGNGNRGEGMFNSFDICIGPF
ncbi:hypothetical protein FCV25MIE_30121 [Fagus crenata]